MGIWGALRGQQAEREAHGVAKGICGRAPNYAGEQRLHDRLEAIEGVLGMRFGELSERRRDLCATSDNHDR